MKTSRRTLSQVIAEKTVPMHEPGVLMHESAVDMHETSVLMHGLSRDYVLANTNDGSEYEAPVLDAEGV